LQVVAQFPEEHPRDAMRVLDLAVGLLRMIEEGERTRHISRPSGPNLTLGAHFQGPLATDIVEKLS
jgi:hypothetical protein